jgi:hypothetical protein
MGKIHYSCTQATIDIGECKEQRYNVRYASCQGMVFCFHYYGLRVTCMCVYTCIYMYCDNML